MAYALRTPRGWYNATRSAQLSGIPRPTLYEWRRSETFLGDYPRASPQAWSYRDLVLLRLLAWLRQGKMRRDLAAKKITNVRRHLAEGQDIRQIRATRYDLIMDGSPNADIRDDRNNLLPSSAFLDLMRVFDLHEPIDELQWRGQKTVWAPDLVRPSSHTRIVPWVMSGDPCVARSRIPTSSLYALSTERLLPVGHIVALYPGTTATSVKDAIDLETRLRRRDALASAI